MRKIILFILVLGQISFAVAQSLTVTGGTSFTGDLVTQIAHHLDIKNTSADTITRINNYSSIARNLSHL